jgi:hypothetical protein
MTLCPRLLPGACLALSVALLVRADARSQDASAEVKAARKDVVALAEKLAGGKAITPAEAVAFRKRHEDFYSVGMIFKPRRKGGLGFGPVKDGDGIEYKLILLSRKALTPAQMKVEQAELARMGRVLRAVAKVMPAYGSRYRPAAQKAWRDYATQFDKEAEALSRAIAGGNPTAVRRAAARVNDVCTNCHSAGQRGVFNR